MRIFFISVIMLFALGSKAQTIPANTRGKKVGHYTQMVWNYTREVGAGVAYCPGGGIVVVASYHPAGNIIGSVPY